MFKEFFEKNVTDFEYSNFLIMKMQILLVAMLLVIFFQIILESIWIYVIEGLLVCSYLFVLFKEVKKEFAEEFKAHALFFIGTLVFVQASWILLLFFKGMSEKINSFFYLLAGLIIFMTWFRVFFRKKFVIGKILLCDEEIAAVKIKYDLIGFVKGGKFIVKSNKRYKKGEKVRIEIKKGFWKKAPYKIVGKE